MPSEIKNKEDSRSSVIPSSDPSREKKWAIVDLYKRRPYIQVLWTKNEAERELVALLRPYGPSNPWRFRLVVRYWDKPLLFGKEDWDARVDDLEQNREPTPKPVEVWPPKGPSSVEGRSGCLDLRLPRLRDR